MTEAEKRAEAAAFAEMERQESDDAGYRPVVYRTVDFAGVERLTRIDGDIDLLLVVRAVIRSLRDIPPEAENAFNMVKHGPLVGRTRDAWAAAIDAASPP